MSFIISFCICTELFKVHFAIEASDMLSQYFFQSTFFLIQKTVSWSKCRTQNNAIHYFGQFNFLLVHYLKYILRQRSPTTLSWQKCRTPNQIRSIIVDWSIIFCTCTILKDFVSELVYSAPTESHICQHLQKSGTYDENKNSTCDLIQRLPRTLAWSKCSAKQCSGWVSGLKQAMSSISTFSTCNRGII